MRSQPGIDGTRWCPPVPPRPRACRPLPGPRNNALLRGYPVAAELRFQQRCWPPRPRQPWPFETESRAPGTGLAMGCIPRRRQWWEVVGW
jgi:hypothetical protein